MDNNYTLPFDGKRRQIERADIRPGLRRSTVRVEARLDGSIAVRFHERYLRVSICPPQPERAAPVNEAHEETAAEAIAMLDAPFPWLHGCERRGRA